MKKYCYHSHCEEAEGRRSNLKIKRDCFAPAGLAMTNSWRKGQSVAEYFLIMSVVMAAIIAVGFLGRIQAAFGGYFNNAAEAITGGN